MNSSHVSITTCGGYLLLKHETAELATHAYVMIQNQVYEVDLRNITARAAQNMFVMFYDGKYCIDVSNKKRNGNSVLDRSPENKRGSSSRLH